MEEVLDFICEQEIRVVLGKAATDFGDKLRTRAVLRYIPIHGISTPLSRSNVIILAIGPLAEIKHEQDQPIDDAQDQPQNDTAGWPPVERIAVKHPPSTRGIEKVFLFIGAKKSFRSGPKKSRRVKRAFDRGYISN